MAQMNYRDNITVQLTLKLPDGGSQEIEFPVNGCSVPVFNPNDNKLSLEIDSVTFASVIAPYSYNRQGINKIMLRVTWPHEPGQADHTTVEIKPQSIIETGSQLSIGVRSTDLPSRVSRGHQTVTVARSQEHDQRRLVVDAARVDRLGE